MVRAVVLLRRCGRHRVPDAERRKPRRRRLEAGDRRSRHHGQVRGRHRQGRADHAKSRSSRRRTASSRSCRSTSMHRSRRVTSSLSWTANSWPRPSGAPKPTSWPRVQRSRRAEAQLKKNIVEAEGPDVDFARRARERAPGAVRRAPDRAVRLGRCPEPARCCGEQAPRRAVAARGQPGAGGRGASTGRASQGRGRPRRRRSRQRDACARRFAAPCSPATSRSAARCHPFSIWARTPRSS